jgi:hypothetical protein
MYIEKVEEVTGIAKRWFAEEGRWEYKDNVPPIFKYILLSEFSGLATEQRGSSPCKFCRTPLALFPTMTLHNFESRNCEVNAGIKSDKQGTKFHYQFLSEIYE